MVTKEEVISLLHNTESSRVERTVSTSDMDKFQEASFDASPCFRATIDDLLVDKIEQEYIPKAVAPEILADDHRDLKHQMASLGLFDLQYDCPTYGGVILFGRNPKQFMHGAYVQYGRFGGKSKGDAIVEERAFNECLAVSLHKLEDFIEYGVCKTRPVFVSAMREEQVKNYPKEALRELIYNAVMHRDYQSNMPTRFYSFNDRIEIMNPGGLYGKARPENFPFVNDYRNPIVAEGMKVMGFVNMFNHGVQNVKDLLKANKNPEPQFNVDKITVFEVITPIAGPEDAYEKVVSTTDTGDNFKEMSEEMSEEIFQMMAENPQITTKEIAIELNKTSRTVERYVKKMREAGIIKRIGATKSGHWEVIKDNKYGK